MTGQIEQIATFAAVAQNSGFAAAGRVLGLSPSIVTRQIAELERRLGVQLFIRSTRKVALTDAGRLYLEQTAPALSVLQQADAAVKERHEGLSGPLRISAPLSFGMRVLPQIMAQFRILHPRVEISLQLTDRMVDIAQEGHDMALRISGPPRDQSTIWRKISRIGRALTASPAYLAEHGTPETPEALTQHNCLHYAERLGPVVWPLNNGGVTRQVPIEPWLTCNNGDTLTQLAELGQGIVLMPRFICEQTVKQGRLVEILGDWSAPPIWLTATYPNYDRLPAKVAAFSKFVTATMQN